MAKVGIDYRNSVVGIIKRKDGKVLITFNKRINSLDKNHIDQNSYKFPQGGIDSNETPKHAIIRELQEELGFDFTNIPITSNLNDYISYWFKNTDKPDFEIRLFAFLFELEGLNENLLKLDPIEVSEIKWVDPKDIKYLNLSIRHDAYLSILRRFNLY